MKPPLYVYARLGRMHSFFFTKLAALLSWRSIPLGCIEVSQDGSGTCSTGPAPDFCFLNSCAGSVCVSPTYECADTANAKMLFRRNRRDIVYNALLGVDVTVGGS